MKSTCVRINLLAAALLAFFSASALALPTSGQLVKITDGLGNGSGGEFSLDVDANNTKDYFSFCVEMTEHITVPATYTIQSVADYVDGASGVKDDISDAAKWVMWNYYKGTGIFNQPKTADLATAVQTVLWKLEDENPASYDIDLYAAVLDQATNGYDISGGVVKVLNLVTMRNGKITQYNQSQLIAEPVPEPATMFLFGTGIAGVAGIIRRRRMSN